MKMTLHYQLQIQSRTLLSIVSRGNTFPRGRVSLIAGGWTESTFGGDMEILMGHGLVMHRKLVLARAAVLQSGFTILIEIAANIGT